MNPARRIIRPAALALLAALALAPLPVASGEVAILMRNPAPADGEAPLGEPLPEGQLKTTRTVAVLYFQNHSDDRYGSFVQGISDMLMTSLGRSQRLTVIERVQIENAMRNFHLEMSGPIDSDTAVEVGAWLGADAVVLGSFLSFGSAYRIDARLIDAQTGQVMVAESVRGSEDAVLVMVDELGAKLVASFGEKETPTRSGTGALQVVFRTVKLEMGERPLYHHICKLYVDGTYMGLSPVVDQPKQWALLFERSLRAGPHRVVVVHGYVRDGDWDGQMTLQPQELDVDIEADGVTTVRYSYEVGWFEDRYVFDKSWHAAPEATSR